MTRRPRLVAGLGLGLVAAVWLARAVVLAGIPASIGPDSGIRLGMIRSFLSGGSLVEVTEPVELHPLRFGIAVVPSGAVFFYPPLFPLLSAVPFRLGGLPGLLVLPFAAGLLACALTGTAGRRLGLTSWPVLGPVTGLATALFFYGVVFWDPALVVCCASVAAWGMARGDARGGAVAGAALGAGAFLHEMLVFLGAAVVAAGFLCRATRRPSVAALATFGSGLAAWAATNVALFGHPAGAHVQGGNLLDSARIFRGLAPGDLWPRVVEQIGGVPVDEPAHVLALAFAVGLFLAARLVPASRWLLLAALAGGSVLALAAERTNSFLHGLFPASPLLFLALLAPLAARDGSGTGDAVAAWMARSSLLFGIAALLVPFGPGWSWGSRYLLTGLPLLVLLAAREAEGRLTATEPGAGPFLARASLAVLLAGSVVLQLRGTHSAWDAQRAWTLLRSEVDRSAAGVVVTDNLAVGPCLVPFGASKAVLYLDRPGLEPVLLARLEREGIGSIGWVGSNGGLGLLAARLAEARPPFVRSAAGDVGSVRLLVRSPASR